MNHRRLLVLLSSAFSILARAQFPGSVDPTFQPDFSGIPAYSVRALAVGKSGSIVVSLQGAGGCYLRRFGPSGVRDDTWTVNAAAPGVITRIILTSDGGAWVGGSFTHLNGLARAGLARIMPSGAVQPTSFGPAGGFPQLTDVTLLPDGSLIVLEGKRFTRLLPDGRVDVVYGARAGRVFNGWSGSPLFLESQSNGNVLITGVRIRRLLPDGQPDPAFAGHPSGSVAAAEGDGWFNASETERSPDPFYWVRLQKLFPDGTVDPSFAARWWYWFSAPSLVSSSHGVVVLPSYQDSSQFPPAEVQRYRADGSRDWGFFCNLGISPEGVRSWGIQAAAGLPDGDMIVGGSLAGAVPGAGPQPLLARLLGGTQSAGPVQWMSGPQAITVDEGDTALLQVPFLAPGTPNFTWVRDGEPMAGAHEAMRVWRSQVTDSGVYTLRINTESGQFESPPITLVVKPRIEFAGSVDSTFTVDWIEGLTDPASLLRAPDPAGSIYTARLRLTTSTPSRIKFDLVRLLANGAVDPTFQFARNESGQQLMERRDAAAVDAQGRIVYVVQKESFDPDRLVRMLPDGRMDPTFSTRFVRPSNINGIMALPNDEWLCAGWIYVSSSEPPMGIVRITSTGDVDSTFSSIRSESTPYQLVGRQSEGQILLALPNVAYTKIGLSRRLADGQPDETFAKSFWPWPGRAQLLRDGRILVLGWDFENGTRAGLTRLTPDGLIDSTFIADPVTRRGVEQVIEDSQGRLLLVVPGDSRASGDNRRRDLVRLAANGALDSSFRLAVAPSGNQLRVALDSAGQLWVSGRTQVVGRPAEYLLRIHSSSERPLAAPTKVEGKWTSRFFAESGQRYVFQSQTHLDEGEWRDLMTISGEGTVRDLPFPSDDSDQGWLRVLKLE